MKKILLKGHNSYKYNNNEKDTKGNHIEIAIY